MEQISLVTASVLALGAASIAAGADGLSNPPATAGLSLGTVSVASIERTVRLVSSSVAPVNSCDAANWPYYPADCLTRSEPAGF